MSDQTRGATLDPMPDLDLTIVYEKDPESDWIIASIPEVRGVHSQGRTREEAREMVLSAMSDWLRFYLEEHASPPEDVPAEAERERSTSPSPREAPRPGAPYACSRLLP